MPNLDTALIEECYRQSLALLRENSTPSGVLASAPNKKSIGRNYTSIFGRDAAICAMGMVVSGDAELIEAARASLLTLASFQAPNGQIPKYVKPESGEADFWYSGCIDATLWWLIAISFMDRMEPKGRLAKRLSREIALALNWLACQEHQVWFLLQQNEASDWADIMPRSGFVLYSNTLWYWVKKLYQIPTAPQTRDYANLLFWPFGKVVPEHRRARLLMHYIRNRTKPSPLFLSFVNFSTWGDETDVFGNILAYLVGVGTASGACQAVAALTRMKVNEPYPIRVIGTPIRQEARWWRPYMQRHLQNLPWQYHNGGIWPFVGGFWIILLSWLGQTKEAWAQLERMAVASRINDWEFNEWFHGESGEPMGMARQSWNAALYILAYRTLADRARYLP